MFWPWKLKIKKYSLLEATNLASAEYLSESTFFSKISPYLIKSTIKLNGSEVPKIVLYLSRKIMNYLFQAKLQKKNFLISLKKQNFKMMISELLELLIRKMKFLLWMIKEKLIIGMLSTKLNLNLTNKFSMNLSEIFKLECKKKNTNKFTDI